jgi:hypothetical protein
LNDAAIRSRAKLCGWIIQFNPGIAASVFLAYLNTSSTRVGGTFQKQMDMVGHQAIRVCEWCGHNGAGSGLANRDRPVVLLVNESFSSLVASDDDMVKQPGGKQSRTAKSKLDCLGKRDQFVRLVRRELLTPLRIHVIDERLKCARFRLGIRSRRDISGL